MKKAAEIEIAAKHPNRMPFAGVLTFVDVASDQAPSGARGHRVILTRAAAGEAIPTLLGMAVDYKSGWDGHDARQKCGVITSAELIGSELRVGGYLYLRDYPELEREMTDEMGMSFEVTDAHVDDMRASIWTLTRVTFTGAAILLAHRAAYKKTSFRLVRSDERLELAAGGARLQS